MIQTENDPEACRELWQQFSPQQEAWDDWDLMFAYHNPNKHHFNFLVHVDSDGQPDGLLPLVFDTQKNRHMLMGGSYPDGRTPWIRHEDFAEVFAALPERTVLFDLKHSWVEAQLALQPELALHATEQDTRYLLRPGNFAFDFNNHIDTFTPDKKQKFNYDLRNIRKREPVLRWSEDNEADLFIELVNRNFGDASDYVDSDNAQELRRVIDELAGSGRLKTLVIEVDGVKQAVSLSAVHGNKMIALYAASNNDINNLGKLLNVETIQQACRMQLDEISYMTGMQWKANWKMTGETCTTLRKPPAPWPDALTPPTSLSRR